MRSRLPAAIALATLLAATPALAGPTCQDRAGTPTRCGTPGAMPLGWTAPASVREASQPSALSTREILCLVALVGAVFALIALMPKFDGRWDRQEGEEEGRD
jgi:hypothetical protein